MPVSNFWAKVMMAVTGLIFTAFVFVHMYGNLHIFQGPDEFDHYAHWLREVLMPLLPYEGLVWILRVVLLACLVLHVGCAVLLIVRARRARGPHRRRGLSGVDSWFARSMPVTGVIILLFVIFHVLDLTLGVQPAATDDFAAGSAYANLVASFQRPLVAGFYVLTMLVLTAHVFHGIWTAAGGDFRAREVDAWRLAEESVRVIDHMDAIGAPFAREYGGQLATRSFGGVQVSRTYYTRGQTGQQLQLAATQALLRQVARGTVNLHTRSEMLDLIVEDGRAAGIVARNLITGSSRRTRRTRSCSPRVATGTSSSSRRSRRTPT